MRGLAVWCAVGVVGAVGAGRARGAVVVWDAASGVTPEHVTPAYALFNTAPTSPTLAGGALTLTTPAGGSDIQGYRHEGPQLSIPDVLRITARVKFDEGSSSEPNRATAGIVFGTGDGGINFLWIDRDSIFLSGPGDVRGPSASVDTDGGFHTYLIEVSGRLAASPVNVFYDGGATPVLSGVLLPSGGTTPEISWGDESEAVSGTSEWQHFEHNAAAVPEPVGVGVGAVVVCAGAMWRRRRGRGVARESLSKQIVNHP